MSDAAPLPDDRPSGALRFWAATPLYLRILLGLALGALTGFWLGPSAKPFDWAAQIILRMLGALAPALILVAVVRAIMTAEIRGRIAWKLGGLLLLNTTVAILIGLGVANVFSPGTGAAVTHPTGPTSLGGDVAGQLLEKSPIAW